MTSFLDSSVRKVCVCRLDDRIYLSVRSRIIMSWLALRPSQCRGQFIHVRNPFCGGKSPEIWILTTHLFIEFYTSHVFCTPSWSAAQSEGQLCLYRTYYFFLSLLSDKGFRGSTPLMLKFYWARIWPISVQFTSLHSPWEHYPTFSILVFLVNSFQEVFHRNLVRIIVSSVKKIFPPSCM